MKTKKIALALFSFLFALFFANAEVVNWITAQRTWTATNGITQETGSDIGAHISLVDFSLELNMQEFYAMAGVQVQPTQTDYTTCVLYAPTFFNHFRFGTISTFHFTDYTDIYFEADYLQELYVNYHTNSFFSVSGNFGYHGKASKIYEIQDSVRWLKNNSIACGVDLKFVPTDKWNFYFSLASYSKYRYMLFFAPDFTLGTERKISNHFIAGLLTDIQYIDMFTLSSNINTIDFKLYAKLEF